MLPSEQPNRDSLSLFYEKTSNYFLSPVRSSVVDRDADLSQTHHFDLKFRKKSQETNLTKFLKIPSRR